MKCYIEIVDKKKLILEHNGKKFVIETGEDDLFIIQRALYRMIDELNNPICKHCGKYKSFGNGIIRQICECNL